MDMQPRFVVRGNAVAFAGRVTRLGDRMVDQLIDIPGNSASLPVAGGLSRGETGRVQVLHDHTWPAPIVAMAAGTTRAWDQGDTKLHVTHVMATGEQLAIAGRFFVERAAAYMRSTYQEGAEETEIFIGESSIVGMRVDDYPVAVHWHTEMLNKVPTYTALQGAWSSSQDAIASRVLRVPADQRQDPKAFPAMQGYAIVSTCDLSWVDKQHPDVALDGHVIRWPGFGIVTVGEMLVSAHTRRLTLLRFNLGSPFAMDGASIDIESNGIGLP
jgi:hypothetical protein